MSSSFSLTASNLNWTSPSSVRNYFTLNFADLIVDCIMYGVLASESSLDPHIE
jgi:hypothetical protein